MSGALEGLKQIAEVARPKTMKRLREAGAMDPRAPLAIARAMPWLLGRGPSLGIVSKMHAVVLGDKPAIHDKNGVLSWRELDTRANRCAHMLTSLALQGNDRVAMVLRNGREIVEVALGSQKLGIIACPLNTWAKPKELQATLEQSDPKVLVYDTQHAEQVEKAVEPDVQLVAVGNPADALPGSLVYEDLLDEQSAAPPPPFARNTGAAKIVIHTSGTTGRPKGAARNASAAGLGTLANLLARVPYRRDDIIFCPAPLFHSFGLATFTFGAALGATLVLPEKFDPEDSLAWTDRHKATAASFVPVMLRRIVSLDEETKRRYDLSSLRIVMASGSVMSTDLRRASTELFGHVLYDLYGSTETGWVAIATPQDIATKPKTVGKPVEGIDVAVFSPGGRRLGAGETGELYIKSNILFEGYTSGESRDERDGYMSIGDYGKLDADGYLFVESRTDDMVVVGGENVYPIEVEQVIESIDGVTEVTVLGIEDEEYGHVLAAFAVGTADPSLIEKTCKAELASYKVPKRIEVLDELPRNATGKVVKRRLIEQLSGATPLDD
ncbi:MAG TPA: AMP-binding protein [Actinomycetota bacterium]|nr:AMP-binding protein [Actinomycetota bacterium]